MAILNDPAPGLRPSMTKESIKNFKAAEWGVGKMGRGLVGVVNVRSGIITIAVGWTASLPQLADLTKNTWGKNHVATLLPPGSKVTEKTDHMLPPLPRGPLGPKKNYPPPQMAAAKSSVAGKPHLPIVHAKYGTQDDRFGHVPATSHYQVLRLLETSDATVSGGRDPYGAVPAVQNLRQKWAQLRNDPYSQEAVNAIVEAERLISTHALQAAEKKQEEMLAEDYLGFGIW